jgi:serine/threonine-protein phosphatase 2B catalytic subunit
MASPHTQQANALRAITERSNVQIPDIDFTQHQLENGEVVITTERVVKDVSRRIADLMCTKSPQAAIVLSDLPYQRWSLAVCPTGRQSQSQPDKQVQAPAMYLPTDEQFFSKQDRTKPDIAFLKNHFYREGRLTEAQALYILEKWVSYSQSCLQSQPTANVEELMAGADHSLEVEKC